MSDGNKDDYKFKWLIPQIYASCLATSYYLAHSSALSFPTFLIPSLESPESDIKVTVSQSSWTATISMLTLTVGSLFTGPIVDKIGAVNVVRLSSIPGVGGWLLIANGTNITMILVGRFFVGISMTLLCAGTMYATEITRPSIRASVLNTLPMFVSLGLLLSNFTGYFVHWRTLAWINNIYLIVPTILISFVPESPVWLIHKERLEDAKKSLKFFNKYHPNCDEEAERQYEELLKNHKERTSSLKEGSLKDIFNGFLKPTGYKPVLLAVLVFFFQQFSGIYIILIFAIIFFKNIESGIDVNIIPTIFSIVRVVTSIALILTMKYFNKRTLMLVSSFGMGLCMLLAGFFTQWVANGSSNLNLVPLLLTMVYVFFALCGIVPIPWTLTSEIFPTNIRSYGQGFATAIGNGFFSLALQNYRPLEKALGGTHAIQFFFAAVAFIGVIFMWFFLPETQNKKLIEIEQYFETNWIYSNKKKKIPKTEKNIDENGEELKELNVQSS